MADDLVLVSTESRIRKVDVFFNCVYERRKMNIDLGKERILISNINSFDLSWPMLEKDNFILKKIILAKMCILYCIK